MVLSSEDSTGVYEESENVKSKTTNDNDNGM